MITSGSSCKITDSNHSEPTFRRYPGCSYLWSAGKLPIVLVTARQKADLPYQVRDARAVAVATLELMRFAFKARYRVVHAMLQASGPDSQFPPHVSLIQMVRGFNQWQQRMRSSKSQAWLFILSTPYCSRDPIVEFALPLRSRRAWVRRCAVV